MTTQDNGLSDTYNTFCTIHIRNVFNATNEWASGVCRTVQVVQSNFLPFPLSYIHGEKTPPSRRDSTGGSIHPSTLPFVVYPWREDPTIEKTQDPTIEKTHHDIAQSGPHHDIVSLYPVARRRRKR